MSDAEKRTEVKDQVDSDTLTISVSVNGVTFNRSLAADLSVSEAAINDFLIKNPGKTAYWSTWHGKAKIAAGDLKTAYEETLAMLREKIRNNAREEYTKAVEAWGKLTREAREGVPKPVLPISQEIDDRALLQPEAREAYDKMSRANEVVVLLAAAVEAMRDLKSTLISLSANMRTEWGSFNNTYGSGDPNTNLRKGTNAAAISREVTQAARNRIFEKQASDSSLYTSAPHKNGDESPMPLSSKDSVDLALEMMLSGRMPKKDDDVPF